MSEIRAPLTGDESAVLARALRRARVRPEEVDSVELVRKSVDRRRRAPELVYTFDLHLREGFRPRAPRGSAKVRFVEPVELPPVVPGATPLEHRPVVVGAGPAGLFAALVLARAGYAPLVLERGSRMNRRVRQIRAFHVDRALDPESNYLFGEGGAGTFSDGKLTSRSKDPRARLVLDEFRRKSGIEVVRYYYRPHLGSDRVRAVVGRLRREIEELGGELRFDVRVEGVRRRLGRVVGLETSMGEVPASCVILAPGHSARDLYQRLLDDGVRIEPKPFQMGVRVEHAQSFVDRCIYGAAVGAPGLGPADYRLVARSAGRGVYSFCMCPGGEIIPAIHDREHYNTNGMSYFSKDTGFANSGVVTTIEPRDFGDDHPLAGLELQRRYERLAAAAAGAELAAPAQRLDDFMAGRPSSDLPPTSCRTGSAPATVAELVPDWVAGAIREALAVFDRQMPGFIARDAMVCGPEARSSAPVRIIRDPETRTAVGLDGLYPAGEGAGYAGGIVSAAVDGWRAAEAVIARFAAPRGRS